MPTRGEAPGFVASAFSEIFKRLVNAGDVFGVFCYENMCPKQLPWMEAKGSVCDNVSAEIFTRFNVKILELRILSAWRNLLWANQALQFLSRWCFLNLNDRGESVGMLTIKKCKLVPIPCYFRKNLKYYNSIKNVLLKNTTDTVSRYMYI